MAKRLRKEEQIMPDIRILTEGDSSVLVEFGKEISPVLSLHQQLPLNYVVEYSLSYQQRFHLLHLPISLAP